MAARRARAPRRFTRQSRPNFGWSLFDLNSASIVDADTKSLLGGFQASLALDLTITRMRGTLEVHSDQNSATEDQVLVVGAMVVNEDAFGAGAASIPGPISDPGADWFWYQPSMRRFLNATTVGQDANFAMEYVVDAKAKRILEPDEVLVFMAETGTQSEGVTISAIIRILTQVRGTR